MFCSWLSQQSPHMTMLSCRENHLIHIAKKQQTKYLSATAAPSFQNSIWATQKKKKHSYFPLYWLVNRDSYNGLL